MIRTDSEYILAEIGRISRKLDELRIAVLASRPQNIKGCVITAEDAIRITGKIINAGKSKVDTADGAAQDTGGGKST